MLSKKVTFLSHLNYHTKNYELKITIISDSINLVNKQAWFREEIICAIEGRGY